MPASPESAPPVAVDLRALAREGRDVHGRTPLAAFGRVYEDLPDPSGVAVDAEALAVTWRAEVEWRQRGPEAAAGVSGAPELWLHLTLQAQVPQTCQRCLQPYAEMVGVDRWFRFVKDEATALAEDDESDEDLLVLEPRFDVAALIEDELLMALPLVPMHGECPQPLLHSGDLDEPAPVDERPHPFAALAALKGRNDRSGQGS